MFCDVVSPDGAPFEADSRYVLKKVMGQAAEKGTPFMSVQSLSSFFLQMIRTPKFWMLADILMLRRLILAIISVAILFFALDAMGIQVEYSHHEVAPSQHEIDLRYAEGMRMADTAMTYRVVVKELRVARVLCDLYAPSQFLVKRLRYACPSVVVQDGRNVFYDAND